MNITEDYIGFENAKLLKEKGFEEMVNAYWNKNGVFRKIYKYSWANNDLDDEMFAACTIQTAMKWLREIHGIETSIEVCKVGEDHETMWAWTPILIKEDRLEYPVSQTDGSVYGGIEHERYAACEAGIKYALENLV